MLQVKIPPARMGRSLVGGVVGMVLGLPLVACLVLSSVLVGISVGGGENVVLLRFLSLGPNKTVTLVPANA